MSNEDSRFRLLDVIMDTRRVRGDSPSKVEYITLQILPGVTEIFCDVQLLVNFTWFIVCKISTTGPSSCEGPRSLLGMEMELVNSLAGV